MFDLHERRKLRRYLFSHLSLFSLVALIALLGWSALGIAKKERETRAKREELQLERDELVRRAHALSEHIEELKTERGIEGELRQRFEVGLPGEELIVIVDPELPPVEAVPPPAPGYLTRLLIWIKGMRL